MTKMSIAEQFKLKKIEPDKNMKWYKRKDVVREKVCEVCHSTLGRDNKTGLCSPCWAKELAEIKKAKRYIK